MGQLRKRLQEEERGRASAVSVEMGPGGVLPASDRLVPVRKFADDLGLSVRTVKRYRQRGWLPDPVVICNRWYYPVKVVKDFAARLLSQKGGGTMSYRKIINPAVDA